MFGRVPVNSTHSDYDANAAGWQRARDVIAGEDAVKAAGERYLPRLDSQSEEEYLAYRNRAAFFNATARTADGYIGLVFRRAPFVKVPEPESGVRSALMQFANDADMLGTSLYGYATNVVYQVIGVGRVGTLVDWEGEFENRFYASLYSAEQMINWRVERVSRPAATVGMPGSNLMASRSLLPSFASINSSATNPVAVFSFDRNQRTLTRKNRVASDGEKV
jgi:hypothetical protein